MIRVATGYTCGDASSRTILCAPMSANRTNLAGIRCRSLMNLPTLVSQHLPNLIPTRFQNLTVESRLLLITFFPGLVTVPLVERIIA
jgi:hypothetical protein